MKRRFSVLFPSASAHRPTLNDMMLASEPPHVDSGQSLTLPLFSTYISILPELTRAMTQPRYTAHAWIIPDRRGDPDL
jgi:hypothetical protein